MTGDSSTAFEAALDVDQAAQISVELRFQPGCPGDKLAQAEIEALGPYLREFATELVAGVSGEAEED